MRGSVEGVSNPVRDTSLARWHAVINHARKPAVRNKAVVLHFGQPAQGPESRPGPQQPIAKREVRSWSTATYADSGPLLT